MIIRKIQEKDLSEVVEIAREVREHHRAFLKGYFLPQDDEMEKAEIKKFAFGADVNISFVAEIDGKIVGMMVNEVKNKVYLEKPRILELQNVGVLKEFQGQGISKKLFEEVLLEAKKQNIQEIKLGVFNDNHIAYKLYEKLGFKPVE